MKKLLLFLLAAAAVGGGIGYYLYNKAPEGVSNKKADHMTTPQALLADFQNDETAANAKYLGKVTQIEGTILEIVPGQDLVMQVVLETGDAMSRVSCTLEEDKDTFLARKLQKGNTVKIKGECTGILDDVIIERAVIVD